MKGAHNDYACFAAAVDVGYCCIWSGFYDRSGVSFLLTINFISFVGSAESKRPYHNVKDSFKTVKVVG